ncbi:unnamed protein product [Spirodela intermedia]|uniref:Uncharacterized protein n=1 Tax=Spirodela intermedia TaxID=51605 RepID=A0A7I8L9R7_SPIIN|nr:unnamed protein product [Spirodela intermedia]
MVNNEVTHNFLVINEIIQFGLMLSPKDDHIKTINLTARTQIRTI